MRKSRKPKVVDVVKQPSHYTFGKIEVLDAIQDWGLDFCRGSALKYLARAGRKAGEPFEKDIRKAIFCLERLLEYHQTNKSPKKST